MLQAEEEHPDRSAIARLRRVAAALARLKAPHPADAAWFVAVVDRYQASCRAGLQLDMDAAMGLGQVGRAGWWTAELRDKRDALLREVHRRYFPDLPSGRAATVIFRLARQVERDGLQAIAGNDRLEMLAEALMSGQTIPGQRQLKRILES